MKILILAFPSLDHYLTTLSARMDSDFHMQTKKKKNQQISSQGLARIEREALHKFFPRTIAVDAQPRAIEPMEIYTG
jgi:hypothetical protein